MAIFKGSVSSRTSTMGGAFMLKEEGVVVVVDGEGWVKKEGEGGREYKDNHAR